MQMTTKKGIKETLMMCLKRFAVLLMVLLVASFSLSAVSFWSRSSKDSSAPAAVEVAAAPAVQETQAEPVQESLPAPAVEALVEQQPQKDSSEELSKVSNELVSLQNSLDGKSVVGQKSIEALISSITQVQADYALVMADMAEKQAIIDNLAAVNAAQADELAYMRGKDNAMHFFINGGVALGFKDYNPTWGLTGNFGTRFGNGWQVSAGAQYMVGDFSSLPKLSWSLDNLSVNATIGYEW